MKKNNLYQWREKMNRLYYLWKNSLNIWPRKYQNVGRFNNKWEKLKKILLKNGNAKENYLNNAKDRNKKYWVRLWKKRKKLQSSNVNGIYVKNKFKESRFLNKKAKFLNNGLKAVYKLYLFSKARNHRLNGCFLLKNRQVQGSANFFFR